MTLLDLCEPLFLYVCRLMRSARKGVVIDERRARTEIKGVLDDMRRQASADATLVAEYQKLEPALLFFIDSMIVESDLPYARDWHDSRLAYEIDELAGDEKFFDLLDEALVEKGAGADQRLGALYACLGLGFEGMYKGEPEYLRSKMMECSLRLRDVMDRDEAAKICPEAYKGLDVRDLIEPPGVKVVGITIATVLLVGLLFVIFGIVYHSSRSELDDSLNSIIQQTADDSESSS